MELSDMFDEMYDKGWMYNKEIEGCPVFKRFEYNDGDSYNRWCILIAGHPYELTQEEIENEDKIDFRKVVCR